MTSERISISSSMPGRPLNRTSTISSKLNSQNGSLTLRGVSTCALVAEEAAVFVVGIDQEDAQVRPRFQKLLQDDRDARRLADAGGAEHGEMLADHFGAVDVAADAGVLLQVADIDRARSRHLVDDAQLGVGHHGGAVADHGIVRDAALEARAAGASRMISPIRSSLAVATKPLSLAAAGTSTETSVIMPIRSDLPLWMDRNLPTVARVSSDAPACAGRRPTVACDPLTREHAADRWAPRACVPVAPARRPSKGASQPALARLLREVGQDSRAPPHFV